MKLTTLKQTLLAVVVASAFLGGSAMAEDEFSFKVTNKTSNKIKKLLVSENGKEYGHFDIGSGIAPGKTVTLVWDKSTNNENCKQYIKVIYDDGSEAEPAKFDFCEEDLHIEWED